MAIEVKTTAGVVVGADPADTHPPEGRGLHTFLGVPYAASPTGRDHLREPRPVDPWDGVRPCDAYGATAPQPAQGFTIVPEPIIDGDNCLNVNVFTPDIGPAASLPVLVWIHGGGFVNGCNASPWYHGRNFAARRCGGRRGQLPARDRGVPAVAGCPAQSGRARLARGPRMGTGQCRRVRRRSGKRDDRRPVGGGHGLCHAARRAPGRRPVPSGDPDEWRGKPPTPPRRGHALRRTGRQGARRPGNPRRRSQASSRAIW